MLCWDFVKPNGPNLGQTPRSRRRLKREFGKDFPLTKVPSFVYMSVFGFPPFVITEGVPEGGQVSP